MAKPTCKGRIWAENEWKPVVFKSASRAIDSFGNNWAWVLGGINYGTLGSGLRISSSQWCCIDE